MWNLVLLAGGEFQTSSLELMSWPNGAGEVIYLPPNSDACHCTLLSQEIAWQAGGPPATGDETMIRVAGVTAKAPG